MPFRINEFTSKLDYYVDVSTGVEVVALLEALTADSRLSHDDGLSDVSANDHHNQAHVLNASDHTVSGLTIGHFLKATGATTFAFAAHGLTYSDVGAEVSGAVTSHESTYNHANYNTAYNWGNHAGLYDPAGTMTTHQSTYNHANYDTAYNWGDHAGGGYALQSTLGTSIGTGLLLTTTVLSVSAILQKYHAIDPTANVQSFLGAANYAAMMALLSGTATGTFSFNGQNVSNVANLTDITTITCGNVYASFVYYVVTGVDAFPVSDASGMILRTGAGGAAPFDQAGSLVYRPRLSDTVGRGGHYFYAGATPTLAMRIYENQDVDISAHNAATIGLMLGGTLVTKSAAQINAAPHDFTTLNAIIAAADAAVDLNSQALTSVGTIGCGTITTTDDYLLANGNYVGISGAERLAFYTAGYAALMSCKVGIGTATPGGILETFENVASSSALFTNIHATGAMSLRILTQAGDRAFAFDTVDGNGDYVSREAVLGYDYSEGLFKINRSSTIASSHITIDVNGNVDIGVHNAATVGLKLGGTLVTASAVELNANDGITANGTSLIRAADYAAMMALLSGEATATFSFNSQSVTGVASLVSSRLYIADDGYIGSSSAGTTFQISATGTVGVGRASSAGIRLYAQAPDAQSTINTAIYGITYSDGTTNTALYGSALGGGGATNIGVKGRAENATYNWAFRSETGEGDSYFCSDVDIAEHDAATVGLKLGGTLVTISAAEANLLDGSVAGTIVNSKGVIYGASGEVNATTLEVGGNLLNITTDGTDTTVVGTLNVTALTGAAPGVLKPVYYNTTTKALSYDNT